MLNDKTFLQGINYLKATYLNWNFDLNNDLMLKVWYKKLSVMDDETFMNLIEDFSNQSKYPPQSPADLLEHLQKSMINKLPDSNEAWLKVLALVRYYGFNYHADKIYQELEDNPALSKTVRQFENELRHLETNDTYTPQRFKEVYKNNLENEVRYNSGLLLDNNTTKLIK